jgi:glycine/D-amino acid oxidase-like deaminating enzyme
MQPPLAADARGGVLWQDQLADEGWPPPVVPPPPLPAEADAVVVGGGYCGMAAAAELAGRGRSVVVVDAGQPGAMASSRNGGMVLPELTWGPRTLETRFGKLGLRMFAAVDEAFDLVESLVAEGNECDYERSGQLYLAHSERAVAGLRALAQEHRSIGHEAEVVQGDELAAELGSTRFPAGLVLPRSGGLHPARYHRGLQVRAERAGAAVHGQTAALAFESESESGPRGGTVVRTERGDVVAGDVLLATNAYADDICPWLRRRVLPIGSYIIATEPLDPQLAASVIPRRRMCFDTKDLLWYWRLSPDGRMVFGGRKGLGREDADVARDHLYASMVDVHPQLAGVRVDRWWGGLVALTRDRLPHCGRVDGAWYATGCNGSGVALNTWMGQAMAGAMCGDELPPFAELPHPVVPLHRWRRMYLPAVGAWYRLRDRRG